MAWFLLMQPGLLRVVNENFQEPILHMLIVHKKIIANSFMLLEINFLSPTPRVMGDPNLSGSVSGTKRAVVNIMKYFVIRDDCCLSKVSFLSLSAYPLEFQTLLCYKS